MLRDLLLAVRIVRTRPRFAAAVVLLLALGIGPNAAIFSVVYTVLVRPLPFDRPDQLVYVWETAPRMGLARSIVSPPNFADWRQRTTVFRQLAAFRTWFYTVAGREEPEQVWGVRVSGNFFDLLRVQPSRGRVFTAFEETPGRDQVVVISDRLWRRQFGADPSLIGSRITVDAQPYTVIGILPASFDLFGTSRPYDLWMPFDFTAGQEARDNYSLIVFGRVRDDISVDRAQAELTAIAKQLEREHPATNADRGVDVVRLVDHQTQPIRPALLMLMAAVGFVLIIACANVVNLLLVHATGRQREMALRAALGATTWRLARQSMAEALVLALAGGTFGLLFGWWTLSLATSLLPTGAGEIPRAAHAGIDLPVLSFTLGLSLLTALIVGVVPAVQRARRPTATVLAELGRAAGDGRTGRARNVLLATQVAVALVLLVAAGLTIRSLSRLLDVPPGFSPEHTLTLQVWLPERSYPDGAHVHQFLQAGVGRIAALPGVEWAGGVNFLPFSGWGDLVSVRGTQGSTARSGDAPVDEYAQYRIVVGDYFRAAGIPLRRGRAFELGDQAGSDALAVVNDAFARRHWGDADPAGRRIDLAFPETAAPWRPVVPPRSVRVIGVAGDVHESGFGEAPAPLVYLAGAQFPSRLMRMTVRSSGDPVLLARSVEAALRSVDPRQAVTDVKTMEAFIAESVSRRRLNMGVLTLLAALAFAVAVGGIWSVVAYAIAHRTREIAIRLSLGAEPRAVVGLIVRQALLPVFAGGITGLGAAFAAARALDALLFGISPADPLTYAAASGLLVTVAVAACWLPARRAARVEPSVTLKCE